MLSLSGKSELGSYIDIFAARSVFPPTRAASFRTPFFRIREHWPGKCFALSPTLLSSLSYMHGYLHRSIMYLMHICYMHSYIFSLIYTEACSASQSLRFSL